MTDLSALIDTDRHRLTDAAWLAEKRDELNAQGVVHAWPFAARRVGRPAE